MNKYYSLLETTRFIDERNVILKKISLRFWAMKIQRRYRMRMLLKKILLDDPRQRCKALGFHTWVQYALEVKAALVLQRNIRGILDRMKFNHIRNSNTFATYLQSVARRYLERNAFQRSVVLRQEAAIVIQRKYRAMRERLLSQIRYMTYSDEKQAHLDKIQYIQQWQSLNKSFSLLQKKHRLIQRASSDSEKIFKLRREREISASIQRSLDLYRLERKVFEHELKEYYDNCLRTHEKKRVEEEQSRRHDIQVRLLAKRRELENQRLVKLKRDEEKRAQYELRRKNEMDRWLQKADDQANLFKEYCHHCYLNPQSETERSLCATMRSQMKRR